jgi:hypothetical protein
MLCSPCYIGETRQCPYHLACLEKISVEAVWEAAVRMLVPTEVRGRAHGEVLALTVAEDSLTLRR